MGVDTLTTIEQSSLLIVDDDPSAIHLVRRALEAYTDVRFATTAADAYTLMQARRPDLILLDGDMPGESGFQFCRRVKAVESMLDIPVIFVTAHDDIRFETQALSVGAADFIPKPISAPRVQLRVVLHLKLKYQLDQLRRLAATDSLTSLANRRTMDNTLAVECARALRAGSPISLLMLDVDYFKLYNDAYGHPAGDRCLQAVAKCIERAARRPSDVAARYGGEEFALLLVDTALEGALHVAQRIRQGVAAAALEHRGSLQSGNVTLSIGAACVGAGDLLKAAGKVTSSTVAQALVKASDDALYSAKRNGRDRVERAAEGHTWSMIAQP